MTTPTATAPGANDDRELIRGVGLWGATTLNMIDMIGVGPFITIPLIIAAMGGPQAMLGWILGAVLVVCYTIPELVLLAWLFNFSVPGITAWVFLLLGGLVAGVYNLFTCDWIAEKVT